MDEAGKQTYTQPPMTPPFGLGNFALSRPHKGEIHRVEGNIPRNLPIVDGARFLFISKDQRALTHGIHKYPAKFFPELPRWLVERYSKEGDTILDPFMGSGTTNLEAMLLGRHSVGVDVDPFSRMLAKVKTTPLPRKKLLDTWATLKFRIEQEEKPIHPCDAPDFPYKENWFKPFMLKELAYIKSHILSLDTTADIKNFFLINFSGIIRAVSEADNNCTRTVIRKKLNKQVNPGMAVKLFLRRATAQVAGMLEFSLLNPKSKVKIPKNADAREMRALDDNSVDCAITSPPYANAVDYPRTHQLEIYWLGFANGSLRDLKEDHVGTEVVKSSDYRDLHKVDCREADAVIEKIYAMDHRRAYIASKYLLDMFANLREVNRVLKHNCPYILVVGNNLIRGIEFETWKYLRAKAPELGYRVECHFVSEIINHFIKVPRKERINSDHILVLRK